MTIWDKLQHFSRNENWGEPNRVSPLLLLTLEALREWTGWPIVIHCAYATSGHSPRSFHYQGLAVDFHFETGVPYPRQIDYVLGFLDNSGFGVLAGELARARWFNFGQMCGLGIYPDWECPGFHLDVRNYPARWGRIGDKYVSFEEALEYARRKFAV